MLTLLFTPYLEQEDTIGIRENRDMFLSERIVARHLGYADSMLAQLTGKKALRVNRPELIGEHGWDTKAGMHALRLMIQAKEILHDGVMHMPMPEEKRAYLMSVRNGEVPKEDAIRHIETLKNEIRASGTRFQTPQRARLRADQRVADRRIPRAHVTRYRPAISSRARRYLPF